jgi:PHD/YefM family antitoxin component YafN of YafNO toxin-antitoxin module
MDAHSLASPDLFARRLRDLCGELARGDYDNIDSLFAMTADAEAPETVRELAEAFGSMAVQIEAREFRLGEMLAELKEANRRLEDANRNIASENADLKTQVQRLVIEIDQTRKEREVAGIVETDYFKALQERAQAMRQRHAAAGPDKGERT